MKIIEVKTQQELNKAFNDNSEKEIRLVGNGSFEIRDSSQVRACDSSQVTAYGSSQVTAYGSSQVTATKYVAVTQQDKQAKIKGGVLIKLPTIRTAHQWCDFYDVPIKAGIAILYKALRNDYKTSRGFLYAPNTTPSAPDWDGGEQECGGGLHFSPKPFMALAFDNEATKFMACPVLVKEIKVHKNPSFPGKVKAPRIFKPCYEVDINGNKLNKG